MNQEANKICTKSSLCNCDIKTEPGETIVLEMPSSKSEMSLIL